MHRRGSPGGLDTLGRGAAERAVAKHRPVRARPPIRGRRRKAPWGTAAGRARERNGCRPDAPPIGGRQARRETAKAVARDAVRARRAFSRSNAMKTLKRESNGFDGQLIGYDW